MIAYKIVEKQTRWGMNWMLFKYYNKTKYPSWFADGLRFKKYHPQYFPRYFKGRIIHAVSGSLGIMCFETKQDAKLCLKWIDVGKVIKVRGIGEPTYVSEVFADTFIMPWNVINDEDFGPFDKAPKGTVAFPAVKVLE